MKVVYTDAHRSHDVTHETYLGQPIPAHEVVERAETIHATLAADGGFEFVAPTEHGLDPILAVHDPRLVRFVEEAWSAAERQRIGRPYLVADTYPSLRMFEGMSPESIARLAEPTAIGGRTGWWGFDSGNPLVEGTYPAARWAVDVALTAGDLVLGGEPVAFGLCRPPGHHAARSLAGGFCFFNNAAIVAESLARRTGAGVAILDVDFHHGNGTQQIFWRRADVPYVSLHGDPDRQYPFFLGRADEIGEGPGRGANLNLPLPIATEDDAYLAALERALDWVASSSVALVVVSLGLDTYREDPLGDFALTTAGYRSMGRLVAAIGRPLVIVLEGGYHLPSLGDNVCAWLAGADGSRG